MLLFAFIISLVFCNSLQAQGTSQYQSESERKFVIALRYYEAGNYRDAYLLYDSLSRVKPIHQRTTASYIMAAKSLQRMKSYRSSIAVLKEFLRLYPMSSYKADAYYSLAVSSILNQEHKNAGGYLLNSLENTKNETMRKRIVELFNTLADHQLEIADLKSLIVSSDSLPGRDLASIKLADKYVGKGKVEEARQLLNGILSREEVSVFEKSIRQSLANIATGTANVIGVVLPAAESAQPSSVRLISSEIIEGMVCAFEENRSRTGDYSGWSLDIRKVANSIESVDMIKEMADNPELAAIVGPLFTDAVAMCKEVLRGKNISLILPTGNISDITEGDDIFQMSPDERIRGRLLAQYAVNYKKLETLAVLTSEDDEAMACAESFSREAQRLGAKIIVHEQYEKGSNDLRDQFMRIREEGFRRLGHSENANDIEEPLKNIDGLFVSIGGSEEIGIVASQISYYNIVTEILGNSKWDDRTQLQKNNPYIDGIVYGTGSFYDETSEAIHNFKRTFYQRMKKYPSSYHALGYDIMNLLLSLAKNSLKTRAEISDNLSKIRNYRGIRSTVTFDRRGINSEIYILEYSKGEVRKLTELSVE